MYYAYDKTGKNLGGAKTKEVLEKILKENNIKYAEITETAPTTPEPTDAEKLATAKATAENVIREQLTATDYKCLKFVDGDLTATEYEETKKERQALREKFNAVEACTTIKELEKLLG